MKPGALAVHECHWASEECPFIELVTVPSGRDSLCVPSLFRSRKVKPFAKIKTGPTSQFLCAAKEQFLQLLDRGALDELCKRVNALAAGSDPPLCCQNRKRLAEVQVSDFLAWVAIALRSGLLTQNRQTGVAAAILSVETQLDRLTGHLQNTLLYLCGYDDREKWEILHMLQEHISRNFQAAYTPGLQLLVKNFDLSIQGQPCPLNVALLCELSSGYVCNFYLYYSVEHQKTSTSLLVEQILHHLLKPYYNKGYHVQLDSSAFTGGRLTPIFSHLGVHLNFVSLWPEQEMAVTQQQSIPGTEDSLSLLLSHLQGWTGPAVLAQSDPWESVTDVFLTGFWLFVHLGSINAYVIHSLQSQDSGCQISLCEFTKILATQLAMEYFAVVSENYHSNSTEQPNIHEITAQRSSNNSACLGLAPEETRSSRGSGMVRQPGLCGLVNSGNSCYMNAVLQCLCSTVPLVEHFLCQQARNELANQQSEVAGAFLGLLEEMWLRQQDSWTPSEMRTKVCALHPQFDNSSQQDSQELLLFLLNALHDDLKKKVVERRQTRSSRSCQGRKSPRLLGESTIVTQLFEGQLSYVTLCLRCDHQTHSNQVFTMLSLPIPSDSYKCSLQDCLALFFQQSTLTRTDQMLCPECGVMRDTAVLTTIVKPPEILVLHLKRFDCQGNDKRKLRTNVLFSLENLDLTPFLSSPSARHTNYSLYGVVNHTGDLDAGHFTAYCHSSLARSWHRFDDDTVSDIQDYLIQSPNAYILFYTRQEFRRPSIPDLPLPSN